MANDLISREALIDDLRTAKGLGAIIAETIVRFLKKQPTVDAVEVVHGRWGKFYDDSAGWVDMCNKCKEFGDGTPYCPNCGAKMDGERKGNELLHD